MLQTAVGPPRKFVDDDDEEDLEALRLAALKSLRTKDSSQSKSHPPPAPISVTDNRALPKQQPYNNFRNQRVPHPRITDKRLLKQRINGVSKMLREL